MSCSDGQIEGSQILRLLDPHRFGEDFAAWLKQELAPLAAHGFDISEPIQEDYGWGVWARCGTDPFWVALSYVGDGPQEEPAQWVVSVSYDPGLNLIKRMFHKPNQQAFAQLREQIWHAICSNRAFRNHQTVKKPINKRQ